MTFKTFTEEQAKQAQTFIDEYKATLYKAFEYILENWYDYDAGDLKPFLTDYAAEDVADVIYEEAEQFTQEWHIPETVADYLAHTNFGLCGSTPFDWLVEVALDSEDEEEMNEAVARCVLWGCMATQVIEDFLTNVTVTIYDMNSEIGREYAEEWGVDVKLFA